MNPSNRYAPVPTPNEFEINEHACLLAKEDGRYGREIFNLIRWPRHASRPLGAFAEANAAYVADVRERARKILTDQMAALHRVRIRRWKRRTNKRRFWTTRPLKHGQTPPPRRRRFRPPGKSSLCTNPQDTSPPPRQTQAPPGRHVPPAAQDPPDRRPCRRTREVLLLLDQALSQLNSSLPNRDKPREWGIPVPHSGVCTEEPEYGDMIHISRTAGKYVSCPEWH